MPLTKTAISAILLAFTALCPSCRCRGELQHIGVPAQGHTIEGMGVEFDPHLWSQNIVMRGVDPTAWDTAYRRVRDMGLKRMRVMIMPAWYEPVNDNEDPETADMERFTMNSVEMQSLYRVLDLAEECGADVTLVMWGCNRTRASVIDTAYRSDDVYFLAEGNSTQDWCVPSTDIGEWCENITVALRWLLETKGYGCIREFTLMNEPNWSYAIDGKVSPEAYGDMCKALDTRLRKEGLRDKVRFNLSDDAQDHDFLRHAVATVDAVADCYNSHTYLFGYETPDSAIVAWERRNCDITAPTGKRHFVGEFGSNLTTGASRQSDIDRFERGVLMTRIALSLLNGGAAGVSYWSLLDQYYAFTDPYEAMQQLGLWRSAKQEYRDNTHCGNIKEDFEPRPQYYAYSLLTRHIPPASRLHALHTGDEFVQGSAVLSPDGRWIYAFANGSDRHFEAVIENRACGNGRFDVYRYTAENLPDDGPITASEHTAMRRGTMRVSLAAQTTALYVERAAEDGNGRNLF